MKKYYKKLLVQDENEQVLIEKVNEILKNTETSQIMSVEFDPRISCELTTKIKTKEKEVLETIYTINFSCIITQLVEE